ncbi:MBL fold metallo-hydrolase [Fusibacter paucivorans]|uniref:MBL fold metallo-hydrolase n=1 Tax=Fusibacter paucivorans TaxID=76009 RepID=A0ABS5PK57_9FIRM|nr:MBL fold metallo-hydrolase [Fusibacter paucivorans]MBS7525393.1 MBL fold metallo-hydrolase [Fusibacter paucivorans]
MSKEIKAVKETLEERTLRMLNNPWDLYNAPFKIVDDVYFVGTNWVSIFLLDTDEGLVLIDCAMQETLYLLIDSIHRLGFDPRDISKILLTHGHFDHVGAVRSLQEISGCEVWIGEGDGFFFTERRDLIVFEDRVPPFKIDHYYDYNQKIQIGDFSIEPVHCPGHTPGTSSLFFDIERNGEVLKCAVHGGLGAAVMSNAYLTANKLPVSLQTDYLNSIDKVVDRKVDIVLPSHAGHCVDHDFLSFANTDGSKFIDPSAWRRMLLAKKAEIVKIIENEKNETL